MYYYYAPSSHHLFSSQMFRTLVSMSHYVHRLLSRKLHRNPQAEFFFFFINNKHYFAISASTTEFYTWSTANNQKPYSQWCHLHLASSLSDSSASFNACCSGIKILAWRQHKALEYFSCIPETPMA